MTRMIIMIIGFATGGSDSESVRPCWRLLATAQI